MSKDFLYYCQISIKGKVRHRNWKCSSGVFHLANIINYDVDNNSFSEGAKIATVRPVYKKSDRDKIENYRAVSILNCFSKVYETFLHE